MRQLSLSLLLFAWLCANGVAWVVPCGANGGKNSGSCLQMANARNCCDGHCEKCEGCIADANPVKEPLPFENEVGTKSGRTLLIADLVPVLVLASPWAGWPGVDHDIGPTRTDEVPVFPPRV